MQQTALHHYVNFSPLSKVHQVTLSVKGSVAVKTNFQAGIIVEYVPMWKDAATDIMSEYFFTRL